MNDARLQPLLPISAINLTMTPTPSPSPPSFPMLLRHRCVSEGGQDGFPVRHHRRKDRVVIGVRLKSGRVTIEPSCNCSSIRSAKVWFCDGFEPTANGFAVVRGPSRATERGEGLLLIGKAHEPSIATCRRITHVCAYIEHGVCEVPSICHVTTDRDGSRTVSHRREE